MSFGQELSHIVEQQIDRLCDKKAGWENRQVVALVRAETMLERLLCWKQLTAFSRASGYLYE